MARAGRSSDRKRPKVGQWFRKRQRRPQEITLEYQPRVIDGRLAHPIRLSIFGLEFYTDLLRRDLPESAITPPWEGNVWKF
jgi:hypothetical protein